MSSNEELSMFGTSHESMDKTNWDALDYSCCRDESWYRKHFPGFDEEIIRILVHCDGTNVGNASATNACHGTNVQNEWEKRQALEKELKEKLTVTFD